MSTKCPCCDSQVDKPLLVDIETNILAVGDKRSRLVHRELEVMRVLTRALPGTARFAQVIAALWPPPLDEPEDAENSVHVVISKLRRTLSGSPFRIRTVHGVGYRLERHTQDLVVLAAQSLQEAAHAG